MFVPRINQDLIYNSFAGKFITTIIGSHRVGKSFLVAHYVAQHQEHTWVQLNMDDREQRELVTNRKLKDIIAESVWHQIGKGPKIWVVIDEAQKCPAIFDQVKLLYDEFKDQDCLKIILTGSSYLHLHQLSSETLAGRVELFYLREFGLRETANLLYQKTSLAELTLPLVCQTSFDPIMMAQHIKAIAPFRKTNTLALQQQLLFGGLPEVLLAEHANDRKRYLSNYLQTYLEKDVRAIRTIENLDLYKNMMEIIAEQTGKIRQDQKLLTALNCNRETLKKYRGYLLATLMYYEVYPCINSSFKRIVKSPKTYLLNNGLVSYLMRLYDLAILEKTGLIGHRLENWFLNELLLALDREVELNHIYYWRTSAGVEVDFVIEKKPTLYPFEVTYATKIDPQKLKNLRQFLSEEPKANFGFYVYMGDYQYDQNSRICFLPAWAL